MKTCASSGLVYPDESTFCFVTGDTLEPTVDPRVGTTISGRFRIEDRRHEGPWSTIYQARERLLSRRVILKVFHARLDDEGRARFMAAVEKARRCTHPNVVELTAGGVLEDGSPYVVHPERPGRRFDEVLRGPQSPEMAFGLVRQLLAGLGRIHDFGAVHGGLRPENILVDPRGHLEIIDVGLGRSLLRDPWEDEPASLHAQKYLAPELSSSLRASAAADIYAVGIVAFQLLTGRLPFEASSMADLRQLVHHEGSLDLDGAAPRLAPSLRTWLANMLERMPAQRPANPHQAMEELHVALEEAGIKPVPDPGLDGASALTVSPDPAFGRWARFYEIFGRMVETGFPKGAPDATTNGLSMIGGRVQDLESIAKKADYEHHGLADVLGRAREGRGRIAEQMDELNESAKAIRKELAPLRIAAERHGAKTETYPDKALELHRDIVRWEGRFGFTEPYKELADAYRAMADHVEKWWSVRSAQLSCESDAEAKEEQLREIDVQLEELREALRIHESNLSDELRTIEQSLSELGGQADRIELELLDTASRFCAPLRSKPQLGPLFRELAQA